jgi:lipopolysaccharide biosynthesis glycosyltransferase
MTNIPIFLAADDNYAPFVATTIASVCDNTDSFVDFYILDGGISLENKEVILNVKKYFKNFSVEFIKIDVKKEFKGFFTSSYITLSSYSRFLIPQLKPNLDKVLYIDVDVVVMGDIKDLYEQDLEEYALGAVIEQGGIDYVRRSKLNIEMAEDSVYFNAGILVIDSKKWRAKKVFKGLSNIVKEYNSKLLCHDQDALNKYFEANYKLLDKKFNVMDTNDEIIIRHFASTIKPWNIPINESFPSLKHSEDFQKYARLLKLNLSKYELPLIKLKLLDMWKNKKLEMSKQIIKNGGSNE